MNAVSEMPDLAKLAKDYPEVFDTIIRKSEDSDWVVSFAQQRAGEIIVTFINKEIFNAEDSR
jgi:hypothetical protein